MKHAPPPSFEPRFRRILFAWAACTSFAVALAVVPAAEAANPASALAAETGTADPKPAPRVDSIPATDIAILADADERLVQGVLRRAQAGDPASDFGPTLAAIADKIDRLAGSYSRSDLGQLAVPRLESVERHWSFLDRELGKWRRELARIAGPQLEDAATLSQRRAVWEATRKSLADVRLTSALADRVDAIIGEIDSAEHALSRPLAVQIELGRRANAVQARIDTGRKTVDEAIDQHDRRLATIDAPPVWKAWQDELFTGDEVNSARAGLRVESSFLQEWSAANPDRIFGYWVTVGVVLVLLLWLAWRTRAVADTDPAVVAAARVLRRPISAWLLLALVGVPLFFPDAPMALHQLAMLLAAVPVLRLLPPQLYAALGAWPYVATGLYVAYRLSFLLLGEPLLYRLYHLAAAVVTAAALVWLLRSSRPAASGTIDPRLRGVIRPMGWAAVLALVVAIAANVAGNVSLAEMLTSGVVNSSYLGLALYAGATVLSSVLHLLVTRRVSARFQFILRHTGPLLASLGKLIKVAAFVVWVIAAASEFRITRPVFDAVQATLTYPLEAGQISVTLGSILLFVIAVWLAFWVARSVRLVLREDVLPRMSLPRGLDNTVATLSYYGLVILGLLIALAAAGFETSQFAIVVGALGVGIGFGLQNVVNNFVSGLILMFERPIQPGDIVEVSGTSGKVRSIGMRATTLTMFEGADVVIPNGTLLSEKLINWTLSDMNRRIDVEVGVAYGSDPRRVLALLGEVARSTPGISQDPEPVVLFTRFGASSLDFSIRAWTNDLTAWGGVSTELTARVCEALAREGIEIPFPQQDLHLRSVSPDAASHLAGARGPAPAATAPEATS